MTTIEVGGRETIEAIAHEATTGADTRGSAIERAWQIAMGVVQPAGSDRGVRLVGSANIYGSPGKLITVSRRVWREGRWQWVSGPARQGEEDVVIYGTVYPGEVIAEYILGEWIEPQWWWLAIGYCEGLDAPVVDPQNQRMRPGSRAIFEWRRSSRLALVRLSPERIRGGWRITLGEMPGEVTLPDPYEMTEERE